MAESLANVPVFPVDGIPCMSYHARNTASAAAGHDSVFFLFVADLGRACQAPVFCLCTFF